MEKQTVICTTLLVETSPQALPLGCACIASAIKQKVDQGKVSVEILDFSTEDVCIAHLSDDKKIEVIAKKILEKDPTVLCFSLYVWNRTLLTGVAKLIKQVQPSLCMLAGGVEVTASAKSFTDDRDNPFDVLVTGEGETAVSDIVFSFLAEGKKPTSAIVQGTPCNLEESISPYLDKTLDATKYSGALWELARGCPYSCSYCYESKGEKKVRYIPKKRLYDELNYFVESGIKQVFVLDPTYNADRNRALDMLRYIEKNAPDIFFHFECRAEFIDSKLARAFSQIPCSLQIGLQSSNEKVLALVERSFNKKDFVRNIGLLNETGVIFGFDLIYGLPGDSYEGFIKSIDFALELYPNHIELFQLSVLPGTALHDKAKDLKLAFLPSPPYLVQESPTFSKKSIEKAKRLAEILSFFYTQGRAVPWFLSLIKPLQKKPSVVLIDIMQFVEEKNIRTKNCSFDRIVEFQKDFIKEHYARKNVKHLTRFAADLIDLNAAISSYIADGTESVVDLNYHPEDLLSPYSQDPKYFVQHAEKFSCRVEVSKRVEEKTGDIYEIIF